MRTRRQRLEERALERKHNVLIVSDDEPWRDSCAEAFRSLGCQTRTRRNGVEAIEILHKEIFDVVVSDDSCHESMDPLELTLNILDLAPNHPLILLGGEDLARFGYLWRHWEVFFAGSKADVLEMIPRSVATIRKPSDSSVGGSP